MISFKKKLQSLVEQLPDEPVAMLEFDQLDKLSSVLATVLDKVTAVYDAESLSKLDDFDLEYFINGLYQAINIQHNWVEANKNLLTPEKLEENTHQLITRQNLQIERLNQALANAKAKMPQILQQQQLLKEQNAKNAEELARFEEEEKRLNELLNNQEQLVQRKQDLEETKTAVEAGKLEDLAREVTTLEGQFAEANQKRQECLEKQNQYAQELQLAINQTETLNNASHVLQQMKTQLEHHQEQLRKDYAAQAENLKIQVAFNQQNGGLATDSVAQKLEKAQQLLVEVEEQIKAKLL
ncbi:MAG TPA: hypothetical protein DCS93_43185 [Microscillaceae bacterium]|nr:hypothetical protein [Microscillaceae bacterium]